MNDSPVDCQSRDGNRRSDLGAKPRRERKTCVFALVPIEMQRFTVTTPQSATLTAPLTRGAFGPYHTFGQFDKREFEDASWQLAKKHPWDPEGISRVFAILKDVLL